ncbi:MAG: hypothetical protein FJZ58_02460 [Chlamydiae bacterium]|nr:hypothetical protein [Chlamydiota bacterium]
MRWLLVLLGVFPLFANPFLIDYPEKEFLQEEDYRLIQEKLHSLSIAPTLDDLYPKSLPFTWPWQKKPLREKSDFQGRAERGIRQVLIESSSGKTPKKELIKINQGSDYCIVSYSSLNGVYPELLQKIPKALEQTGFQGYFLSLLGAFPNPTGKEIRYAGVPYCFKLFAMLEAKKLGFHKVLWIDAALLPLRDPTPLFHCIEDTGSLLQRVRNGKRYLLPVTRDIILERTGTDMYQEKSLRARVIGFDLSIKKVQTLLQEYEELVALGTPFLSCFPEEFVLGALLAKNPDFWPAQPFPHLVFNEHKCHGKSIESIQELGAFFLIQQH